MFDEHRPETNGAVDHYGARLRNYSIQASDRADEMGWAGGHGYRWLSR